MSKFAPTVALLLHFREVTHTVACVGSLIGDRIEHVVIVDNSADGGASLAVLRHHIDQLGMLTAHYLCPGRNLGFSAGVNFGAKFGWQQYPGSPLLLINSDATLVPGAHASMRKVLEARSTPAVIAPLLQEPAGERDPTMFYHHLTGLARTHPWHGASHAWLSGCCLLLPPVLADSLLFDESFFFYGDDIELGFRLARRGIDLVIDRGARALHVTSGSSKNGSMFYEYHTALSHMLLVNKLGHRLVVRLLMVAARSIVLTVRALKRCFRSRSWTPWCALRMAFRDARSGERRDLTPAAM